jgi:hypothetical protein
MPDGSGRGSQRSMGGMILTVADMSRLEQAARLSMGGFQDLEASASQSPRVSHPSLRLALVVLAAVIVLIVASQLSWA